MYLFWTIRFIFVILIGFLVACETGGTESESSVHGKGNGSISEIQEEEISSNDAEEEKESDDEEEDDSDAGLESDTDTDDTPQDETNGLQPALSPVSCCEVHDEPGCNDSKTQSCVCKSLPDCCSKSWGSSCTMFVIQKSCEPGVRDCLCGSVDEGGWEQNYCCEDDWTDFCSEVAIQKCDAKSGCVR